jgi:hypothetical protein
MTKVLKINKSTLLLEIKMKFLLLTSLLLITHLAWSETSEEERAKKKVELTIGAGADYRMSPTQVAAYYFLSKNDLLGIKVGVDKQGEERQTSVALQYKNFTGNSFYVAPEFFYLNTREDESWFLSRAFNIEVEHAEYISYGAGVRIGNQWSWKHWSIGVDWIGIGRRIGVIRRDTDDSSKTTYTIFNVYAGLSF